MGSHVQVFDMPVDRTWPPDWELRRSGAGCPKCREGRPDDDGWGVRFGATDLADAYLIRRPPQPGYVVVVFRGRHVADPCDLTDNEALGYGRAVRAAAKAVTAVYGPCHLNYQVLGNGVPHLHTHILARYVDDPAPGQLLPPQVWRHARELSAVELEDQLVALRRAIPWGI
jgi:diadenosine tetraphosphate (Ap4A) HIT family hydrolase